MVINPIWEFNRQENKWGYVNNPRWTVSPQPPVSYNRIEGQEPQIWKPEGVGNYSVGNSKVHFPCGHWHKVILPLPPGEVCTMNKVGNFAIVGMANEGTGRLVKLGLNPLSRLGYLDDPDGLISAASECWSLSYDIDNGIAYLGMNCWIEPIGYACKITKINISTMTLLDTLILSTNPPGQFGDNKNSNITGMSSHPENGYIYVVEMRNGSPYPGQLIEIQLSDFTVVRTADFLDNSIDVRFHRGNTLFVDAVKGKAFYVSNGKISAAQQSYVRRFDLGTFTEDIEKAPIGIPVVGTNSGQILGGKCYDKCNDRYYCVYCDSVAVLGVHIVTALAEVNTLTMEVTRTLALPLLPTDEYGQGLKMDISDTYIYILAQDSNQNVFIRIINKETMGYVNTISVTPSDVNIDIGCDIGVLRNDNILEVYCYGTGVNPPYDVFAIYIEYDISSGIPVFSSQVLFDDSEYVEAGNADSVLVTSQKYNQ